MKVVLCSTSDLKKEAIQDFFRTKNVDIDLKMINCDGANLPAQPMFRGYLFAVERVLYARRQIPDWEDYDMIIAIENYIGGAKKHPNGYYDFCHVVIFSCKSKRFYHTLRPDEVEEPVCLNLHMDGKEGFIGYTVDFSMIFGQKISKLSDRIYGYDVTYGDKLVAAGKARNTKNWMVELTGVDRTVQIRNAIDFAWKDYEFKFGNEVELKMTKYPDFPKPGVLFEDMFSALADSYQIGVVITALKNHVANFDVNYIVGLESRGFILGCMISGALGIPFIPVRKAGKLPGEVVGITYTTEYSTDKCEMQTTLKQVEPKNRRVIIVDDLIATGGSVRAAVDLLNQLGATIVDIVALKEVVGLKQVAKAKIGLPYTVLF